MFVSVYNLWPGKIIGQSTLISWFRNIDYNLQVVKNLSCRLTIYFAYLCTELISLNYYFITNPSYSRPFNLITLLSAMCPSFVLIVYNLWSPISINYKCHDVYHKYNSTDISVWVTSKMVSIEIKNTKVQTCCLLLYWGMSCAWASLQLWCDTKFW